MIETLGCAICSLDHLKAGVRDRKVLTELNIAQNCWICEGWSQYQFGIKKKKVLKALEKRSLDPQMQFANVHLSFDGYKPRRLQLEEN